MLKCGFPVRVDLSQAALLLGSLRRRGSCPQVDPMHQSALPPIDGSGGRLSRVRRPFRQRNLIVRACYRWICVVLRDSGRGCPLIGSSPCDQSSPTVLYLLWRELRARLVSLGTEDAYVY